MYKLIAGCLSILLVSGGSPVGMVGPAQPPTHVNGRALVVGINDYKNFPRNPTPGAEEDAVETKEFLKQRYGFAESEIKLLRGAEATADRIVNEFRTWLINQTRPGDRVFFLYSGHGTRVKDDNGDEADGEDEALAAYDADRLGGRLIRDDVFNQLIGELSGRMLVMVFDSCHSGTMTRAVGGGAETKNGAAPPPKYLPSPEEFAALSRSGTRAVGGGGTADFTIAPFEQKGAQSRDLQLVVDRPEIHNTGVVIFSAAHSGQRAYPVEVEPGHFRGALSYAFNQSQRESPLPLRELKLRIAAEIKSLQSAGRLNREQQPAFEIIAGQSGVSLEDQPLFGAAQMAQTLAEGNPGSKMTLKLRMLPEKRSVRVDESFSYQIETSEEGYLYLLALSEENQAACLLPNPNLKGGADNWFKPGVHRAPPDKSENYVAKLPLGRDIILAIFTKTKLNLGEKEVYTWNEIFDRLRNQKLFEYVKTRGVGTAREKPLGQTDWQAVSLEMETIR
jgi:metacaspase-1